MGFVMRLSGLQYLLVSGQVIFLVIRLAAVRDGPSGAVLLVMPATH